MKVAICLSGQLRTFDQCFQSQDTNLFQVLQPDIFVHTWDRVGVTHKTEQLADPAASFAAADRIVSENLLQNCYTPRAQIIEPFLGEYYTRLGNVSAPAPLAEAEPIRYKGALPMTYGMKKALKLMQQAERDDGQPYDIVVRLRPDITVLEPLPPSLLEQPDTLWWPLWPNLDPAAQVSDKLAFSSSCNMAYYLSLFDYLPRYWQDPLGAGSWAAIMVGERIMRRHISAAPFPDQPFELKMGAIR